MSRVQEQELTDRNRLLRADDPHLTSSECGSEVALSHVIDDIQSLIFACYDFGLNPLPHLREYFPSFEWTYKKFGLDDGHAEANFLRYAASQDYTWIALKYGGWNEVVSARQIDRSTPRKFCICPDYGDRTDQPWPEKGDLQHHGIKRVWSEYNAKDDTHVKIV